jgi:LCP family protein required for cell wall assembly
MAYGTVRALASHTQFRSIPILPVFSGQQTEQTQSTDPGSPAQSGEQEQEGSKLEIHPDIKNKERVTILFLGLDQRPGESATSRTDTMILFSINPKDMSLSMLSIPRDLWVPIPGHKEGRINTAHYWGEADDYPGGGPALAKHTVRYNFGVPVHYYVRLNFTGFEQIIDAMGGIDINVPTAIDDHLYPAPDNSYMYVHFDAGPQHMDGATALKYARTRRGTGDGDFSRMDRQRQVILAIRDKVLSLPNLPQLVLQLPQLAQSLGESLQTDIPASTMLTLAKWAQQINREDLRSDVLDRRVTEPKRTADGQDVLLFDREKARPIIEALFSDPDPATPTAAADLAAKLEAEGARVAVYNGTAADGLAGRISSFLQVQGINVVASDNADRHDYERTTIRVYADKPNSIEWLTNWLTSIGVAEPVLEQYPARADMDLSIVIGLDFPVDKINSVE